MTHSKLTNEIRLSNQRSSRNGAKIDRFIVHHVAGTNHDATVNMMVHATRQVSANYVVGDKITLVVDEDYRAWTSGTSHWDGRAITVETVNNSTVNWTVSDKTFDNLARLMADCAFRYGFPLNDNTVLTHQELYTRYGASYPTACPGDLQRRKAELITLANKYLNQLKGGGSAPSTAPSPEQEADDDMRLNLFRHKGTNDYYAINPLTGDFAKMNKSYADLNVARGICTPAKTVGMNEIDYFVQLGRSLKKTGKPSDSASPTTQHHTIAKGDTFYALASKYKTTVANLTKLNPGVNASNLEVGKKIRVK